MFSVLYTSCYKICNNTYKLCFFFAPKIKKKGKMFWIIHLIQRNSSSYWVEDIHNMVNSENTSFDCIFQHGKNSLPNNNDWWRVGKKSMSIHSVDKLCDIISKFIMNYHCKARYILIFLDLIIHFTATFCFISHWHSGQLKLGIKKSS